MWLADTADPFRTLADGLRLIPRVGEALLFQIIHDVALMLDRERAGARGQPGQYRTFLEGAVLVRKNIIISGATDSG